MTQPHLKAVARFVRDLLDYDEQLIKFDRRNVQASDFSTGYIVVIRRWHADRRLLECSRGNAARDKRCTAWR
ncbi:hypothetical protein A2I22_25385 [Salmonella enterica]|nr:hypothetical protein [Salmonella enterica]EAW8685233.1 hypothetical protein [Salmonella enterica]EAX5430401.1 hypothetical protein [Salmonella enterica]EAY9542625.1 hypothetical protein [Salmonella enterica]